MSYEFDLGPWSRKVSTTSQAAQLWFDRGLNWTYAFNHEEAVACFRRAAHADAGCAMAWWGVAYAMGPFYNRPWIRYSDAEIAEVLPVCHDAAKVARSRAGGATPAERALIDALANRYRNRHETDREILTAWHRDYADAMRGVYRRHPGDPDIAALYVEAAITCTPRPYGQGVAHAALGDLEEAEAARCVFDEAAAAIPEDAIFASNTVRDMLRVGEAMLDGELEYRKKNHDRAFERLRLAVSRDDALNYTEPWAWMHPPRHALGALLAEQGMYGEAEAVFRADLGYDRSLPRCCQHPDNVWALQGLVECVEQTGDVNELRLLRQRLDFARARADIPIDSACFCRNAAGSPIQPPSAQRRSRASGTKSKGTGAEHRQGGQSEKDAAPNRTTESGHAPSSGWR